LASRALRRVPRPCVHRPSAKTWVAPSAAETSKERDGEGRAIMTAHLLWEAPGIKNLFLSRRKRKRNARKTLDEKNPTLYTSDCNHIFTQAAIGFCILCWARVFRNQFEPSQEPSRLAIFHTNCCMFLHFMLGPRFQEPGGTRPGTKPPSDISYKLLYVFAFYVGSAFSGTRWNQVRNQAAWRDFI